MGFQVESGKFCSHWNIYPGDASAFSRCRWLVRAERVLSWGIALLLLFLVLQVVVEGGYAQAQPIYRDLAVYWAPVICQDIDDENVKAEYITRFNYDGDWRGGNNWNDLNRFDLPAYVYYWVTETQTHYFIGYAFFHPRDWSSWGMGEHENDMEGILLTIRKQQGRLYGQFVSMITVAHTDFWSYTDQDTPSSSPWYGLVAPSRSVTKGHETIDGDVDFAVDDCGFHPVVYIQSEGHGVLGKEGGHGSLTYKVTDYPPVFNRDRATDWRGINWSGIRSFPNAGTSGWGDGIVYHYEGTADVPTRAGNPKDWQIVGYDLVSIGDLWDRRYDYRVGKVTFERYGTFDGDDGADDAANAPWGWDDHDDGPSYVGDFFGDPAKLVDHYFNGLGSFSCDYLGNSYSG